LIPQSDTLSDIRAISSVNILKNYIPVEQAKELVAIMQAKEKLITLCGLSGEEAELDFSGQNLGVGDAMFIANNISDMRALKSLDISNQVEEDGEGGLGAEGAKCLAEALKYHP
jgi:hypothetical protein